MIVRQFVSRFNFFSFVVCCFVLTVKESQLNISHVIVSSLLSPLTGQYVTEVNGGKCTFPAMEMEEGKVVMLETMDIITFLTEVSFYFFFL